MSFVARSFSLLCHIIAFCHPLVAYVIAYCYTERRNSDGHGLLECLLEFFENGTVPDLCAKYP